MESVNFLFKNFDKLIRLSDFHKKLLKKLCGERVIDLLLHFPYDLQFRTCDINKALNSKFERPIFFNEIIQVIDYDSGTAKTSPFKIICNGTALKELSILYFNGNKAYLRKKYPLQKQLFISGRIQKASDGSFQIVHPDIISSNLDLYKETVDPVYSLITGLTNSIISSTIRYLLRIMPDTPEWIPADLLQQYSWPSFKQALFNIHFANSLLDISRESNNIKRIAFDELIANKMCMKRIRGKIKSLPSRSFKKIECDITLPFELTKDQQNVLREIESDLQAACPMNRLLQGDVGSGKTIVAFLAALNVLKAGSQVAFLAPTEALALQHFATLGKYASQLGITYELVISKNRKDRKVQCENIKLGLAQLIVGTHALLEDNIEFNNLELAVIDEQQCFGVLQRMKLLEKGQAINALYLSATPIPRTMMLSIFGDLDVSVISSKPESRKPINTSIISKSKLQNVIERIKMCDTQVYWICPYIEASEEGRVMDVNTRFQYLKSEIGSVGLLHGKMKPTEKDIILNNFRNNKIKILVATTVIEVGIDVPNANIIIIENAELFGLAQLHQLRGRVGRGDEQAYCVLMYGNPISKQAIERLQLMKQFDDGFTLSEADLKLRGHGDLLGTMQSGFHSFKIFDIQRHSDLLEISNQLNIDLQFSDILLEIFNRRNDITLM